MRNLVQRSLLAAMVSTGFTACGGSDTDFPPAVDADVFLNDTGAAECVDSGGLATSCPDSDVSGQDAEFGRDASARAGSLSKVGVGRAGFDFTKLASNGEPLAIQTEEWNPAGSEALGSRWSCVRDNVTKLVWETKQPDPGSWQFYGHTYSWFSQDARTNGSVPGEQNQGQCGDSLSCDTASYIAKANTGSLCGRGGWRLPTVTDLLSIIDHSQLNPPLDTAFFPSSSLNAHWTSQTVAENPDQAWYIYFTAGESGHISKAGRAHIRLVATSDER